MAKKAKVEGGMQPDHALVVEKTPDETGAQAVARRLLEPNFRHAVTASAFSSKLLNDSIEPPGVMDFITHMQKATKAAEGGDLAMASRMLAGQAISLDNMFTELARRAALNMGEYMNAAERYGRLALKAQSNCRATLETLAKLHQPREQTVRHVHVNEGGKAVITEQFHQHTGGQENAKNVNQSLATGTAGASPALSSPNTQGNGVPISSREREATLQNARGD